jgi:hypothetical protein
MHDWNGVQHGVLLSTNADMRERGVQTMRDLQ